MLSSPVLNNILLMVKLFTHPKIAQVAVFGMPDPRMGEEIVAWVQLHAGETMSEDELCDFCRDGLAHFKVPKFVRFVDDFPMTVTGKLQKFKMRETMEAERTSDLGNAEVVQTSTA